MSNLQNFIICLSVISGWVAIGYIIGYKIGKIRSKRSYSHVDAKDYDESCPNSVTEDTDSNKLAHYGGRSAYRKRNAPDSTGCKGQVDKNTV